VKRSFNRVDPTGGKIRFAEVHRSPVEMPAWLALSSQGKATTVVSVHPRAIESDEYEDDDDFGDPVPSSSSPYVPKAVPANDARVPLSAVKEPSETYHEVPSRRETIPPTTIQPASNRRSEIPRAPRSLDTLVDELIPRADEEAVGAITMALEEFAAARERALREAEDDLFALVKLISERVLARELRTDTSLVTNLVREGLAALSSKDACTVRLGCFYSGVIEDVKSAVSEVAMDVSVVLDPSLPNYGCVVETQLGKVDESVDVRLRTLLNQLDAMRARS
jgi:vacuolar-type H+-ATPase subunit E/Vma4